MVSFRNVLIATCPDSPYHLTPDCYTSPVTYPIYGWGSNVYCLGIWSGYCNTGSCTTTCLDDCWIRIDDQSGGVCN